MTEPNQADRPVPQVIYEAVADEVGRVLIGKAHAVEHLTIALLTRGHLLLEGVPGIAKTTLANLFARASGLEYRRIQLTPDTLPADITGTNIYQDGEFDLQRGPVFTNFVLADEINRATPKTQSALLEAMEERQVTIEGETLSLPEPFIVVATQNPIEMEGVFELPEAQRDRFQFKLVLELPERAEEEALLARFDDEPQLGETPIEPVASPAEIARARAAAEAVHISEAVRGYILDLVAATRAHPDVEHGASPRASLAFLRASKARAAIRGREYVIPDDVKALAEPVLVHRLVLRTDATLGGVEAADVVADCTADVEQPDTVADAVWFDDAHS